MSHDIQLGAAIVGLGKVADAHALGYLADTRVRFVGGLDAVPDRRAAFAAKYGCRSFETLEALADDPDVHVVSVCSPHTLHADQAVALLQAGKHVLVEKPMALTTADADRMIAAANVAGRQLGVVSQRRFYEPVRRMRAAIDSGRIGRPVLGTVEVLGWRSPEYYAMDPWRGTWAGEGGGVLVTQVTHQLDLFLWLMGESAQVAGFWANLNHPAIEVEDTAIASVRFASGALGSIVVSNSQNPGIHGRIHVYGSLGYGIGVQTDGGSPFISGVTTTVELPYNDLWTIPDGADLGEWRAADAAALGSLDVMTHYHGLQIHDFVGAVLEGRPPAVTAEDGRQTVALFEAIYQSGRTHAVVALGPSTAQEGPG